MLGWLRGETVCTMHCRPMHNYGHQNKEEAREQNLGFSIRRIYILLARGERVHVKGKQSFKVFLTPVTVDLIIKPISLSACLLFHSSLVLLATVAY